MRTLWVIAVVLGLLYLAIWAGMKGGTEPATPRPSPTADLKTTLSEAARGDAIGRVGSEATLRVTSVTPQFFVGPELNTTNPTTDGAKPGLVIQVLAEVNGQPTAKLVYHAVPPRTVVFVRQEAP